MKRNKKHNKKGLENFLDYSGSQMTGRERNIFEKDLQKDPFETDAAEGLSTLSREEVLHDMKELTNHLSARTGKSKRFIFYRAAAAVAAILVVGTLIILLTSDLKQIFERVAVTENSQPDKENIIRGEEKSEQVISEESLTESEVPATNIPAVSENETGTSSEPEGAVKISESAEENKKQIVGGTDDRIETRDDTYLIDADKGPENVEENKALPIIKATKSETSNAGKIITRKYIDNYVRGVVISSEDKLPLPGATVKIRGTTAGTYTDQNGNFELPVQPNAEITLVAEYIGMEQSQISLDTADEVQITLAPSETDPDEVVVIGYGVQKKSNITGAISTIEIDDNPDYQLPSPVIGNRKFKEYIKENLQYPSYDTIDERNVVVLNFVIAENGRPKNISVLKSPGKSFSDEAIRLLVSGPDWYPAKRNGKIIEEGTMIRIVFKKSYE
jgi:hypothetical protein